LAALHAPRTVPAVRGKDLTRAQAAKLKEQVRRQLAYLNRLVERMKRLGFDPTDPLYTAAIKARDAQQDLHVAAIYAGIRHGVAKLDDGYDEGQARRA
jgi:hypothetical protein